MEVVRKKYRNVNSSHTHVTSKGDILFYCLILIIPLTQIAIFYFGVNTQSILMAFQNFNTDKGFYWDVKANFSRFASELKDNNFWRMVGDSFIVWICTQFAGTVFALFFSYYIYKKKTLFKFFKFILFLPSIVPALLLVLIFKYFMNKGLPPLIGTENILLENPETYFWIVTAFTVWISFGSQVLIYSGAMDQIPNEILEAGKLDGITPFREFVSLIVPYILPTVSTFIIVGIATIFTNQNNLFSFYGDMVGTYGNDKTIGYYLYCLVSGNGVGMSNYCYASFLGLTSTLIAVPLTFIVRKILSKWGDR